MTAIHHFLPRTLTGFLIGHTKALEQFYQVVVNLNISIHKVKPVIIVELHFVIELYDTLTIRSWNIQFTSCNPHGLSGSTFEQNLTSINSILPATVWQHYVFFWIQTLLNSYWLMTNAGRPIVIPYLEGSIRYFLLAGGINTILHQYMQLSMPTRSHSPLGSLCRIGGRWRQIWQNQAESKCRLIGFGGIGLHPHVVFPDRQTINLPRYRRQFIFRAVLLMVNPPTNPPVSVVRTTAPAKVPVPSIFLKNLHENRPKMLFVYAPKSAQGQLDSSGGGQYTSSGSSPMAWLDD